MLGTFISLVYCVLKFSYRYTVHLCDGEIQIDYPLLSLATETSFLLYNVLDLLLVLTFPHVPCRISLLLNQLVSFVQIQKNGDGLCNMTDHVVFLIVFIWSNIAFE